MKKRQLSLFKNELKFFGGKFLHKKRRRLRPLSTKNPIHLVMRSSWAKGEHAFLQNSHKKSIERLLETLSKKYGVAIYQKAIVSNHIHLVMRIHSRKMYHAFVRVLSGQIASLILKGESFSEFQKKCQTHYIEQSQKHKMLKPHRSVTPQTAPTHEPQGLDQNFWQFRPFTRVLHWGRDFKTCSQYVIQNTLEALGFIAYVPRKNYYSKWIQETLLDTA